MRVRIMLLVLVGALGVACSDANMTAAPDPASVLARLSSPARGDIRDAGPQAVARGEWATRHDEDENCDRSLDRDAELQRHDETHERDAERCVGVTYYRTNFSEGTTGPLDVNAWGGGSCV